MSRRVAPAALQQRQRRAIVGESRPFFAISRSVEDEGFIELGGECDASSLDELNAVFADMLASRPKRVTVDLAQTTFVDSLTLGAFVVAAKRLAASGGSFEIVGVNAVEVRHTFELTGLDKHLLVRNSE